MDLAELTNFLEQFNISHTIKKRRQNNQYLYSINSSTYKSVTQIQYYLFQTFHLKVDNSVIEEYLNAQAKVNSISEKDIQAKLAKELSYLNARREVSVADGTGFIDILTDNEIIEVKRCGSAFKGAIGQLLYYKTFYPDRTLRLHLFGKPIKCFDEIYKQCQRHCIKLTYESI